MEQTFKQAQNAVISEVIANFQADQSIKTLDEREIKLLWSYVQPRLPEPQKSTSKWIFNPPKDNTTRLLYKALLVNLGENTQISNFWKLKRNDDKQLILFKSSKLENVEIEI